MAQILLEHSSPVIDLYQVAELLLKDKNYSKALETFNACNIILESSSQDL